ncbi:hypothetical protein L0B53_02590 [Vibrio sp. SS-MA-C1-2]|uniref:hypothetical protein n=1 Tax=Vibrio sp. SS-MA-C1-2 TaxID=2908646 RepID=UPI001F28B8DE|nr:hypothetical protein [Vibrio sp. SS-MA-C1-2]UJF16854.1 hypothetical protein L0B53_02590 [Vibrio sp. SS-MA-C1-2]
MARITLSLDLNPNDANERELLILLKQWHRAVSNGDLSKVQFEEKIKTLLLAGGFIQKLTPSLTDSLADNVTRASYETLNHHISTLQDKNDHSLNQLSDRMNQLFTLLEQKAEPSAVEPSMKKPTRKRATTKAKTTTKNTSTPPEEVTIENEASETTQEQIKQQSATKPPAKKRAAAKTTSKVVNKENEANESTTKKEAISKPKAARKRPSQTTKKTAENNATLSEDNSIQPSDSSSTIEKQKQKPSLESTPATDNEIKEKIAKVRSKGLF